MNFRILQFTCVLAVLFGEFASLRAQVVADGATNTLSNTTNSFASVTIGTNGSFTLLTLSNNALLTNSGNGTIGLTVTAKSNEVRLISPTARWRMGNNFYVGSNGAFSRLVISNGALVENFNGVLANVASSSNNAVLVTGAGTTWSNRGDLAIGFSGRDNQLIVSNGGFVFNRFGYLGQQLGGSNNVARVTGSGSVWSNQFYLTIGGNDRSNRLIIEAGGLVTCSDGFVSGSSSSGNNEVLVTGAGSIWSNSSFLFMGDVAGRNRLVVSNGATLWSGGSIVGTLSLALSNQVIVTGPGSVWTNESSLSLAESSQGNRVDVSDGGRLECTDGMLGQTLAANDSTVFLTGNGSSWNNRASLIVGNSGSGNRLVVSNAARVYAGTNGVIGFNAASSSNTVSVTGAGSTWSNQNSLFVGQMGSGNRFDLSNGASADTLSVFLGVNASSSNNEVTVTGPGSIWRCPEWGVGNSGRANRLLVSNGGQILSSFGSVGAFGGGGNLALVADAGSSWINDGEFFVGIGDGRNTLVVSNAGLLTAQSIMVGRDSTSLSNRISVAGGTLVATNTSVTGVLEVRRGTNVFDGGSMVVDQLLLTNALGFFEFNGGTLVTRGAAISNGQPFIVGRSGATPSVWDVRASASNHVLSVDLRVGNNSSFNQLVVSNGASLRNNNGLIGYNLSSSNLAVISGSGSVWSNAGLLAVGNSSQGNRLVVSNGAAVRDTSGYVGLDSVGNNLAAVTGPGSLWTNSNDLFVGTFGSGNRLVVNDGGEVRGGNGFVGVDASASNNLALISGSGSVWSNALELYVGYSASGNQLVVSNGAVVFSANRGFVGFNSAAVSNSAVVVGPGSRWMGGSQSEFYIGSNSPFNRLIITNGGLVTGNSSYLGHEALGRSNLVIVTGTGSLWSNRTSILEMGQRGSGNRLVITNGGSVSAFFVRIGRISTGVGNEVVVTGSGSSLIADFSTLRIGETGSGNRVEVNNGGKVFSRFGDIGADTGSNNLAVVTGPGSVWTNSETFVVGRYGNRNRLIVSNAATLFTGQRLNIGEETIGTNNQVLVDGGVLVVTNASRSAVLEVRRGTNLFNAGLMDVDQLLLTNALGKFEFNGGMLITRGALITNNSAFNVGSIGSTPAVWDVRTGAGAHVVGTSVNVGYFSPSNQMLISGGATMTNGGGGIIGLGNGAGFNTVIVAGAGSRWLMSSYLYVGYSDQFNRLLVTNGGFVTAGGTIVGGESNPTNSELIVSGPGSIYSNAPNSMLQIGSDGATNRVRIENGGLLQANVLVGFGVPSTGNALLVSGSGSRVQTLTNLYPLTVGLNGAASRLEISDGAVVSDFGGTLGSDSGGSNNLALVTGAGSLWTNHGELRIGQNGDGNLLVVSNGATVFTFANKALGYFDGSFSNTAIITDPGSAWLGDDSLYVGGDGSSNRLFVRNGARVTSGIGTLGGLAAADGNQVLVTDSGSSWTNQLDLNVGEGGSGNRLTISNSAIVASLRSGFIGRNYTAASNSVTVTDPGSRWLISSNLFVGSNGPAASLVVVNGGRVENAFATLGGGLSSSNNWALISGAGSILSNRNNVLVGGFGRGNLLVVSNGARVESDFAVLANGLTSSNNGVLISGSGSVWSNRNEFHVGLLGPANQLVVANGGRVDCNHATVGLNTSASNNLALVTDAGSFLRANSTLTIGNSSGGNRLVVSNGAAISGEGTTIGIFSANNEALATGPGTTWTNRVALTVGHLLGNNRLVISNGAFVLAGNVFVSFDPGSTNNRVVMHGGTLLVTNVTGGAGALDVRRGTNVFNAGLIDVTRLFVTNALGRFEFNGGMLVSRETVISNGSSFTVGNGMNPATFTLRNGTHSFADNLVIASNASLIGNGTITGSLTVNSGGELRPGTSVGNIILSNSPVLLGTTIMEIRNDNQVLSHDRVQIAAPLVYDGSIVVTNTGTNAFAAGNRFPLFSASGYSGAFTSIVLPPLPATLRWTNKLVVDGSLEVVPYVPPPVALTVQVINGLLQVSWPTNGSEYCLETSYDLSPPITWQTVSSGITTNGPSFVFTLANVSKSPKQFFRLAFPCAPSPLVLSLQLSNNLVTVSWPSNEFRLETTFDLSPPAVWQTVSNGISNVRELRSFTFTNSPAVTKQFFRLAFP